MIRTSDRQDAVQLIDEARTEGARLQAACAELGIVPKPIAAGHEETRIAGLRPCGLSHGTP